MRGFPLFNLLAVVAVLLLMLWPLLRVDRPAPPGAAAVTVPSTASVPVLLGLRFVREPQTVEVRLGDEVLPLRGSGLERQGETRLVLADRSLELAVDAVWPPGTGATMMEVRAAPDGLPEQQQNLWGEDGSASDIIRFTWRAKP